jgi:hypothetical protein
MSHGTDALYGFAAQDPRRTSAETIPLQSRAFTQNILANVALAFVAATCAWTLWSHLGREEVATLAERFAALDSTSVVAAPTPAARVTVRPKDDKGLVALFDARHMSSARAAFTRGEMQTLSHHMVPSATSGAPGLQIAASPEPAPVREIAQGVPVPLPRPSRVASLEEAAASEKPLTPTPPRVVEDKATVLALISSNKSPSLFQKLFGKPKSESVMLAYASPDGGVVSDTPTILFDGKPKYDQWTAVYDISARKVYMPDGTELEAHSGLGKKMDDPRHVHVRMHGATPPHVYDLTMREALFHGTEAIRMTPVGGSGRIYGRAGILAHPYLLGPRGDSNGCVSFKNYDAFLQAFKKGQVKRMVVVERLA